MIIPVCDTIKSVVSPLLLPTQYKKYVHCTTCWVWNSVHDCNFHYITAKPILKYGTALHWKLICKNERCIAPFYNAKDKAKIATRVTTTIIWTTRFRFAIQKLTLKHFVNPEFESKKWPKQLHKSAKNASWWVCVLFR